MTTRQTAAIIRRPGILTRRWHRSAARQGTAFWLIVMNGVVSQIAMTMLQTGSVISAFLMALTGDERAVGIAVGFGSALMLWPQYFVSGLVARQPYRMPLYRFAAHGRWLFLGLMTLFVIVMADHPKQLMVAFTLAFSGFSLLAALVNMPFQDITARTIPSTQRGKLWGMRLALGGFFSVGLGVFVRYILSDHSPLAFPYNYASLFGLGLLTLMLAQSFFMRVPEPPAEVCTEEFALRDQFAKAKELLARDPNLRRYLWFRSANVIAASPMAFLLPCAMVCLNLGDDVAGTMISLGVAASIFASYYWSKVSDGIGNRSVLFRSHVIRAVAHTLALFAALFSTTGVLAVAMLFAARAIIEMSMTGMQIGNGAYMAEMSNERDRPFYIGLVNTVVGQLLIIGPVAMGFIAKAYGYVPVFLIGILGALLGCLTSRALLEPRTEQPLAAAAD